jgi:hypothetical protein
MHKSVPSVLCTDAIPAANQLTTLTPLYFVVRHAYFNLPLDQQIALSLSS